MLFGTTWRAFLEVRLFAIMIVYFASLLHRLVEALLHERIVFHSRLTCVALMEESRKPHQVYT
jgi:hypothetical protein